MSKAAKKVLEAYPTQLRTTVYGGTGMKYIAPKIDTIVIHSSNIMVGGPEPPESKRCDFDCKIYHYCMDRTYGDWCFDKHRY